jgi:chromatin remodeling complex protein RSC6
MQEPTSPSEPPPKPKRQPSAAFMKPVEPDEKLAAVVGNGALARTEVTRKLWDYIRAHNLQDPANKTFIVADDKLKALFDGRDRVSMFEMTKLVFNHVKK